ncbi:hypothetical protein LU361_19905, partial [Marinibactrum sp. C21]
IPNSVVKRYIADGSVGIPHVRVGHRQALKSKRAILSGWPFFYGSCFRGYAVMGCSLPDSDSFPDSSSPSYLSAIILPTDAYFQQNLVPKFNSLIYPPRFKVDFKQGYSSFFVYKHSYCIY